MPTNSSRAVTGFDEYLGQVAAHGRPDLHIELKEAMRQVADFGGYAALTKALGIPRTAIEECGGLGIMRTRASGRYFKIMGPRGHGADGVVADAAVIVPVWQPDLGGDLVDLLALRLDHPAQFLVRTGAAKCLGMGFADDARSKTTLWALPGDIHPSLTLFPNPLIWLRGNCQGTALLHETWVEHTLCGVRSVTAYNERHARALNDLFTWPSAPTIFLQRPRKAAAA